MEEELRTRATTTITTTKEKEERLISH